MRLSSKQATLLTLILCMVIAPFFFPSGYYFRIGSLVFINGLAVVGIVILTGYAGQISLGHAGFAGIGGYACALGPLYLGIHPSLALVLGAIVSAVMAYLVGRPILRLKGYYLAVASLGFGILVSMVLGNETAQRGNVRGVLKVREVSSGLAALTKSPGQSIERPIKAVSRMEWHERSDQGLNGAIKVAKISHGGALGGKCVVVQATS